MVKPACPVNLVNVLNIRMNAFWVTITTYLTFRAKESWSYAAKVILLMISKFSSNGFHDLTSFRHTISKIFIIFQQNFVHINAISCRRLRLLLWKPTALQKKIPRVLSWWYTGKDSAENQRTWSQRLNMTRQNVFLVSFSSLGRV